MAVWVSLHPNCALAQWLRDDYLYAPPPNYRRAIDFMNRVLRLIIAIAFLASGTFSAMAEAHALCDGATNAQHDGHQHNVPSGTFSQDPDADISEKDPSGTWPDGAATDPEASCHTGGLGCPGCVTPQEQTLLSPAATKDAFRYAATSGQSAEQTANRRPPKLS